MIDVKELRIGNWLMGKDTDGYSYMEKNIEPFQVDSIDDNRVNPYHYSDGEVEYATDVTPILLTPEVLKSCGFVDNWKYFIGGIFQYSEIGIYVHLNDAEGVLIHHIKHLHQLQNLYFALTGQELNYTP